ILVNSLNPDISQRIKKSSYKTTNIFNIYAIINILNENTNELISINMTLLRMNCANNNVIASEIAVCNTPKNKSAFVGDKIKFAMNTPTTIPKKYFLLNTMR